jgi:hypothetical protein
MKTTALIIKEGRVCCTDKEVPEKPIACSVCEHEDILKVCACEIANKKYRDTIQLIKDNAVPIDESQQASFRLMIFTKHAYTKDFVIKDDTFYPVSVEVEIITVMSEGWQPTYNNPDNSGCEQPAEPMEVARIVEEPVSKDQVYGGKKGLIKGTVFKEEPVEKKPELLNDVPKSVIDFATWYSGMERVKVINAYKRYLKEEVNSQVEDQEELFDIAYHICMDPKYKNWATGKESDNGKVYHNP